MSKGHKLGLTNTRMLCCSVFSTRGAAQYPFKGQEMAKKTKKADKKEPKKVVDQDTDLLDVVNKEFGAGALIDMSSSSGVQKYDTFSTGSLNLDDALGIGGLPRGRIVEIFGPEASGKTTIALQVVASAIAAGHKCAYIDAEHALDIGYAKKLGVDLKQLYLSQPDYGEQALNITDTIVRSGQCAVVVVDSVSALIPKSELDGDIGDHHMGLQARMMSQAMRKLTAVVHVSNTLVIFINQVRMKIGVTWGSPETTTGGNALKFYASIRLRIARIGSVTVGAEKTKVVVANKTQVRVAKNKCSPPFKEAEFEIVFGEGVSVEGEMVELGIQYGHVEKAGAWLSMNGERLGQGKENAKECLKSDPIRKARLLKLIKGSLKQ